jgi:prepilin-type N-terminal cleavage/methylation domain-containing protein
MKRQRPGFTILELLTVIMIIGVVVAIATPKMGKINRTADLRSSRDHLAAHIATARHIAIQRSVTTRMQRSGNMVWVETLTPAGATLARDTLDLYAMFGTSITSPVTQIRFDPRGFSTGGAPRKFVLKSGADLKDSVCVTGMGVIMKKGCAL